MRILSGIQPSGKPHLGNYFSMMRRMIEYQDQCDLFCFIASYHSLTVIKDGLELKQNILELTADFLALGLNTQKSVFWVQSDVPQVTELAWILSQHIPTSHLELAHSYKDKIARNIAPNAGLLFYPILMAADILAFGADRVPVGSDQKQHLEMCRNIGKRFNQTYGEILVIPEPDIQDHLALVPGIDGRKMSKSYKNTIYPFAPEKELKKAIMSIVTDSKGVNEAKDPDNSVLYQIYSLFLDETGKAELAERFRTPGTGYGHIKEELFKTVLTYFDTQRRRRAEWLSKPDDLRDILTSGAKKAAAAANVFLQRIRDCLGLRF